MTEDVFLNTDFHKYHFPENVMNMFSSILQDLSSTGDLPARSLSSHIDGFVRGHGSLGTRIIEFDEEQHFTPFRRITLEHLSKLSQIIPIKYLPHLLECCNKTDCFNRMLNKHRIKAKVQSGPQSIEEFKRLVELQGTENNGYIKPKRGFDFLGGRIAQRAYYDTLRDVAHLAKENLNLKCALRFTKYEFEDRDGRDFLSIDDKSLCSLIEHRLEEII